MIRFIQDYTTKALPPEVFEKGDEVSRSEASELYLVRLGVAGFVHEGNLVDADFNPIVVREVEVVAVDRRFAATGRAGETLGILGPDRATSGPGNAAMGLTNVDPDLHRVQVEQLSSDLAASMAQLDEHRTTSAGEIDRLTADLTTAQGAREAALADLSTAKADQAALVAERDAARAETEAANKRIGELETALAAATTGGKDGAKGANTK